MKFRPRTYKAVPELIDMPSGELSASIGLPWKNAGMPKLIIGRREWISFPELGLSFVKAKTDSGAWNSTLHADDIELSEDKTLVSFVSFNHHGEKTRHQTEIYKIGKVKSSTGVSSERIFIRTPIIFLGGLTLDITLSLSNRSDMLCPMLLGRRTLAGFFLIDPQSSYLLGKRKLVEAAG